MNQSISQNLSELWAELPQEVQLVAVSKFHPVAAIQEACDAGQRLFGESRVQELQKKVQELPADVHWHFIGHLQQNKVKYLAPYVDLIHSVDSERLLAEINRQAERCGRKLRCLLQVHVAKEETKFGFLPDELLSFLDKGSWQSLAHVQFCGLMCMASNVDDMRQVGREFHKALTLFEQVKRDYFPAYAEFAVRSWGMSHDYHEAIAEGSTMIRVGTKIFGERQY